jgi:hypothetical protein
MTCNLTLKGDPTSNLMPATKQYVDGKKGIATAWVNFNGTGTVAIRDSFNVSSITDGGTGKYTVNFTNAMANENYVVAGSMAYLVDGKLRGPGVNSRSTTAVAVRSYSLWNDAAIDADDCNIVIFGG